MKIAINTSRLISLLLICSPWLAHGQQVYSRTDPRVEVEIESCQFIGTIRDDDGKTVPPGLDEELHCDHKCFYEELGKTPLLGGVTMQEVYSVGWRLIHMVFMFYNEKPLWTLYFERPLPKELNECYKIYGVG